MHIHLYSKIELFSLLPYCKLIFVCFFIIKSFSANITSEFLWLFCDFWIFMTILWFWNKTRINMKILTEFIGFPIFWLILPWPQEIGSRSTQLIFKHSIHPPPTHAENTLYLSLNYLKPHPINTALLWQGHLAWCNVKQAGLRGTCLVKICENSWRKRRFWLIVYRSLLIFHY